MANIQKTLDSLQPYVIGIRYVEGTPLVDAIFKEGWAIPEDKQIKRMKGNEEMNYFMIYSEVEGIGLDELLGYVERTIKLNQEREKKHELLRKMVTNLKDIFQKNSLSKLTTLKFVFTEEDLVPKLDEFDIESELMSEEVSEEPIIEEVVPVIQEQQTQQFPTQELTEEEKEMLEEEARAERNRQILKNKKSGVKPKIELPPKQKIQFAVAHDVDGPDCDCGPDEACSKCIDSKGY